MFNNFNVGTWNIKDHNTNKTFETKMWLDNKNQKSRFDMKDMLTVEINDFKNNLKNTFYSDDTTG